MFDRETAAVECFSGHAYAQEPRLIHWQQDRYPVAHVEARWRTPVGAGFRVTCAGGDRFELLYEEQADRWSVRRI
jgi:hypothetical protein